MKILLAYGTTEGQTRKIIHHMEKCIEEAGHSYHTIDCGEAEETPDFSTFDAVVVAGSVHQEKHQRSIYEFVTNNLEFLNGTPSGFVSVSLSASLDSGKAEAEKYISDFLMETSWKPTVSHTAAGAVRFLEYDFFKRFTVEYMVLKGKSMPDEWSGNPEYTDWDALGAFVDGFLEQVN